MYIIHGGNFTFWFHVLCSGQTKEKLIILFVKILFSLVLCYNERKMLWVQTVVEIPKLSSLSVWLGEK